MSRRGTCARRRKSRRVYKALHLEKLESRQLFSAGGTSTLVSPDWFADYTGSGTPDHAGAPSFSGRVLTSCNKSRGESSSGDYDWIVQFNTAALARISTAAQSASLLSGGAIQFEVLRGLGLQGQVLARSHGVSAAAAARWLAADPDVASYEMDGVRQVQALPNDPRFSSLWGLRNTGQTGGRAGADINAADAWSISTGDRNVVVAVIDTGVDYTHIDLAANIWTNSREVANGLDNDGNGFAGDLHGYNFDGNNGSTIDDNGHGTHVAGTIGAAGNNGQGVTGINWSVSIMPLKFLNSAGMGYTSNAIRAVNYATMMRTRYSVNVRVINASWGSTRSDSELSRAIQAAGDAGILFVSAAGNSGANNDLSPQYPANYRLANTISVAATDASDQLASFSCYGAATVDLAAPGAGIYSTARGGGYQYMSGTSMATPHVAGVAALAWAAAPNATVAQVRNAILQGVDRVASLTGKVATGGRLDAYNTLRLLAAPNSNTPVIASLLATPSAVEAGRSLTLTAQGVDLPGGTITGVSFYQDSNSNGQWDTGDRLQGSAATVINGQASLSVSTAGMNPGAHRFFARAADDQGGWSAAAWTQITIVASDDHGNSHSTATPVSVGGAVQGVIGSTDADVDWFRFEAVAGRNYRLQTSLGTLGDSVLSLYDPTGQGLLASNDDISTGNLASRITWHAPASGTYYLKVTGYDSSDSGSYWLSVALTNTAPVLPTIANQTVAAGGTLSLGLGATDADGDRLTYSVRALTVDSMAQQASNLDQQLGLTATTRYRDNARGWRERYIAGSGGSMYFVVPDGTLYRLVNANNIRRSVVVARLTSAYYVNPALLYNAPQPALVPVAASTVGTSLSGDTLTMRPAAAFRGAVQVVVTVSDGTEAATQTFSVTVTAPAASPGRSTTPAPGRNAAPALRRLLSRSLNNAVRARSVDMALASGGATQHGSVSGLDTLALNIIRLSSRAHR